MIISSEMYKKAYIIVENAQDTKIILKYRKKYLQFTKRMEERK